MVSLNLGGTMTKSQFYRYAKNQSDLCKMSRVVLHWTAGANEASSLDLMHYHALVEEDSDIILGDFDICDNASPLQKGEYAAHTLNCNSGSIGLAVCGMAGGKLTKYPITENQFLTMLWMAAACCVAFGIEPTEKTVLHHGSVERILKVRQRGKWDCLWLPYNNWSPAKIERETLKLVRGFYREIREGANYVEVRFPTGMLHGILQNGSVYVAVRPLLKALNPDADILYAREGFVLAKAGWRIKWFDLWIKEGVGYSPVREVAEWLGHHVEWDGAEVVVT